MMWPFRATYLMLLSLDRLGFFVPSFELWVGSLDCGAKVSLLRSCLYAWSLAEPALTWPVSAALSTEACRPPFLPCP